MKNRLFRFLIKNWKVWLLPVIVSFLILTVILIIVFFSSDETPFTYFIY